MSRYFFSILILISFTIDDAMAHKCEQSDKDLWREGREFKRTMAITERFFRCIDRSDPKNYEIVDRNRCYWFGGWAVESLYGLSSFRDGEGYFSASQMSQKLHADEIEGWVNIGSAGDQETLNNAADLTKNAKPVIAAWLGRNGQAHVSLILPGGLAYSGSWGMEVPNSANISFGAIQRSFYGCRLSFALSKNKLGETSLFSTEMPPAK